MQNLSAVQKAAQISRLRSEVERIRARNLIALQEIDKMDDWLYETADIIDKFFNEDVSSYSSSNSDYSDSSESASVESDSENEKRPKAKKTKKEVKQQQQPPPPPPPAKPQLPLQPIPQQPFKPQMPVITTSRVTPQISITPQAVNVTQPQYIINKPAQEQIITVQKNPVPTVTKMVPLNIPTHQAPVSRPATMIPVTAQRVATYPHIQVISPPQPHHIHVSMKYVEPHISIPEEIYLPQTVENQVLPPSIGIIKKYNRIYEILRQFPNKNNDVYQKLLAGNRFE